LNVLPAGDIFWLPNISIYHSSGSYKKLLNVFIGRAETVERRIGRSYKRPIGQQAYWHYDYTHVEALQILNGTIQVKERDSST